MIKKKLEKMRDGSTVYVTQHISAVSLVPALVVFSVLCDKLFMKKGTRKRQE